jgi:hypothetical protein
MAACGDSMDPLPIKTWAATQTIERRRGPRYDRFFQHVRCEDFFLLGG